MENKKNNLLKVLKSKQFKDKLGQALFITRISSVIYKARVEKKLSQSQLSKMAKTTQRIVSDIENGNYNMGCDLLYRLLKSLDKTLISDGKDLISGEICIVKLELQEKVKTTNFYGNIHINSIDSPNYSYSQERSNNQFS